MNYNYNCKLPMSAMEVIVTIP